MLSPVSRRFASNPVQSLAQRVQAPQGDAKSNAIKPLDAKQTESLQQVLSSLEQLLEQLVKQLSGGKINPLGSSDAGSGSSAAPVGGSPSRAGGDSFSPGGSRSSPSGLPSLDGSSGPSRATPSSTNSKDLLSGIQVSDPRVQMALEQIATHPDGAKLIAAAKANGLSSISVNPSLNPDGGSGTQGETFWGNGNTRIELADSGSPDLVQTLAHELGHAATTQDGDSQLEENTVDALGNRIQKDLLGYAPSSELDQNAYSSLSRDNGILNSLRSLGIRV
jgi:hypothetical protein